MTKDRTENMLTLVGAIIKAKPDLSPVAVSRNIAKLNRLAVTLRKRYENGLNEAWACDPEYERETDHHEAKAKELANELGLALRVNDDPNGAALALTVNGYEYLLF